MTDHKWIHPPLKLVEEINPSDPHEISQDDLNQSEVNLYSFDIPEEDRRFYADDLFKDMEGDREAHEEGEDLEPVDTIVGFFLAGDADLSDPGSADIFVHSLGPEREYPSVYAPVGQHADGWPQPGDYLISIEDYLAISKGLYTPAVYTCEVVRDWDPHKSLRPNKETA